MEHLITAEVPKLKENPIDVIQDVLAASLFNKHSGYDVDYDDVLQYLDEFPDSSLIKDRVHHFKLWLKLDPSQWCVEDNGHRSGMYYSNDPATPGMLCNPDGTRSIFDDVDK